jgi:hypothetical protein
MMRMMISLEKLLLKSLRASKKESRTKSKPKKTRKLKNQRNLITRSKLKIKKR